MCSELCGICVVCGSNCIVCVWRLNCIVCVCGLNTARNCNESVK